MHSEGSSDLDLSFISSSKDDNKYESKQKHSSILGSSQHYQIDSLISELKSSGEVYKIEEKISKIALQYGLALKVDVIAHKLSQVSHKNDTSYSEKYKKVNEIMNEITRLEENIKKNYNFVDNVIIPQLKAIGYSHKEQLKKYSMMKKLIAEYENDERFYNQNLEQFLVKSKPRGKLSNLSNEELEKCLQALKEKLTQRNIRLETFNQKVNTLESIKAHSNVELLSHVDQLKDELRREREELKGLKKEKKSILNKIEFINSKFNDAQD